jgi:hypothetical protein
MSMAATLARISMIQSSSLVIPGINISWEWLSGWLFAAPKNRTTHRKKVLQAMTIAIKNDHQMVKANEEYLNMPHL